MLTFVIKFQVKELEEQINGIRNRHHDNDAPIPPFEQQQVSIDLGPIAKIY